MGVADTAEQWRGQWKINPVSQPSQQRGNNGMSRQEQAFLIATNGMPWGNPYGSMPYPGATQTRTYGSNGGYSQQYRDQKGSAQQAVDYYKKMLDSGGAGASYQRVLDAAEAARRQQMGQSRRFVKGERKALRKDFRRGKKVINRQTEALQKYLERSFTDPYQAPVSARVDNVDTSSALLADQGAAGAGPLSAEQQQTAAYNARADQALGAYNQAMSANAEAQQRAMLAAARMSGNSAMRDLRDNRSDARRDLRSMMFGARQNAWNQYNQANMQTQAQIAQQEQATRDALIQLAIQYGLRLPF